MLWLSDQLEVGDLQRHLVNNHILPHLTFSFSVSFIKDAITKLQQSKECNDSWYILLEGCTQYISHSIIPAIHNS